MKDHEVIMVGPPCIDEYYDLDTPPVMGEKAIGRFVGNKIGGMISNAATISASYGLRTALIDTLNHSPSSMLLVQGLKERSVDPGLIAYDDKLADAKCIILLCKGERTILVIKNDKHHLSFNQDQLSAIGKAKVLYSTIADLVEYDNSVAMLKQAKEKGVQVVYDIEGLALSPKVDNVAYLTMADVIFINEGGVQTLSTMYGENLLASLSSKGTIVVKTLGCKGCSVMSKGKKEFHSPAFPVKPVDTTGAGDTFNSSFVYGLLQHWSLQECAHFANGAAGRAITIMGAQSGACGVEAVKEFIDGFKQEH